MFKNNLLNLWQEVIYGGLLLKLKRSVLRLFFKDTEIVAISRNCLLFQKIFLKPLFFTNTCSIFIFLYFKISEMVLSSQKKKRS